jgi:hypothetical protein
MLCCHCDFLFRLLAEERDIVCLSALITCLRNKKWETRLFSRGRFECHSRCITECQEIKVGVFVK